jgi:hypothetical protein
MSTHLLIYLIRIILALYIYFIYIYFITLLIGDKWATARKVTANALTEVCWYFTSTPMPLDSLFTIATAASY